MNEQEKLERNKVVETAKTYLKTPYHHMGRIKGSGVDCLTLLANVFEDSKLIDKIDIPFYPKDWHLHRDAERYFEGLLQYTKEIKENPQPGDIVLWKFGRCYSHGAIVIKWPVVIHAHIGVGCCYEDVSNAVWLTHIGENTINKGKIRPTKFFSYWRK